MGTLIGVHELKKVYRVAERNAGLGMALHSLIRPTYKNVEAVRSVSFEIEAGEIVGFIGPNGAGKTTTLKMLSGLLVPSSGSVHVAGYVPWERKNDYLKTISMVMGNKGQMAWDIPPLDTFYVLGAIYRVPRQELQRTIDELVELMDMQRLLTKPVRGLSLGERMKCELVAALLHKPQILFLDEPTLGLDVSMQRRLREFISAYNKRSGVTIMLTSHYMADVAELCSRLIVIHHGALIYDGSLEGLTERLAPYKLIRLTLDSDRQIGAAALNFPIQVEVVEQNNGTLILCVPHPEAPALTAELLRHLPVNDLTIEEPPIETVIDQIYREGAAS